MKISVFGLGYVGAVSLACLGRDGHDVIGVDIDETKLDLIRRGRAPIVEEGIEELMASVVASGRVNVTTDVSRAILESDVTFVCVGTPSSRNGGQDLSALERCIRQIGTALAHKEHFHSVIVRSTVQPGTINGLVTDTLESYSNKRKGHDFGIGFQPEFLREGSSIRDYDNPPFTVVGTDSDSVEQHLRQLFAHLPAEFIRTRTSSAELLKYACNAFHAVKVTFANEMGRISKSFEVDPHEVMELLCRDTRLNISRAYLRPGFAFGGSCLPKDLRALLHLAKLHDVVLPVLGGVLASNAAHVDSAVDRVLDCGKRRIGQIGLSFKTGTDDLRESPLVTMAERFIGKGLDLAIYDPYVELSRLRGANRRYIEETIPHIARLMSTDLERLVAESDVVILALSDAGIVDRVRELTRPDQFLLDLVGVPHRERVRGTYEGVCW